MKGICSRCGREGEVQYGYDGLPYCNSCIFYGNNRPCWRCRMYYPIPSLQEYEGHWYCPSCLIEVRSHKPKRPIMEEVSYPERCERCGREMSVVYIYNGRRLCEQCVKELQNEWEIIPRKPMGPGAAAKEEAEKPDRFSAGSVIRSFVNSFLLAVGLKKPTPAVSAHVHKEVKRLRGYAPLPEFGKPLVSDREELLEVRKKLPEVEGIMKGVKRRKK